MHRDKSLPGILCESIWHETFVRTIIEAYAKGTPVVASNLGAMAELVDHGRTGLLFQPGDAQDLVGKVNQLWHDPANLSRMRLAARQEFELRYTAPANERMLLEIYHQAIGRSQSRLGKPAPRTPLTTLERDPLKSGVSL